MKKCLLLLFSVCIIFVKSYSQETFSKQIERPGLSYSDKTIIASNADLLGAVDTDSGVYVFRVNLEGKLKWEKVYGERSLFNPVICATNDNGFTILSLIFHSITNSFLVTLIKCDSSGNIEWSRSLDGGYKNNNFYAGNICTNAQEEIIITYKPQSKTSPYPEGIQLLKFDKSGNLIFQTGFKDVPKYSYSSIILNSVIESYEGGYLIGFSYVRDETSVRRGYFILTGKNGDLVSYKQFTPHHANFDDDDYQVNVFKHDGKYYVLGYYFNYKEDGDGKEYYYITSFKNINGFRAKGKIFSYNPFALQQFVRENNIPVRQLDKYVIDKSSISFLKLISNEPPWILAFNKYDSLGRTCPDYELPVYDYDTSSINIWSGKEMSVRKSLDTIKIINNVISEREVDYMKNKCSGNVPSFTSTDNLNSVVASTKLITVFPNPAHEIITIALPSLNNKLTQINIYNTNGKLMQTVMINSKQPTINIASYPKGLYAIKIVGDDNKNVLKFIKQ